MANTFHKLWAATIVVIMGLGLFFGLIAFQGLVASFFWLWFMTPLGLPQISILHASGMILAARTLIWRVPEEKPKTRTLERATEQFQANVMFWAAAFGLGWLISLVA